MSKLRSGGKWGFDVFGHAETRNYRKMKNPLRPVCVKYTKSLQCRHFVGRYNWEVCETTSMVEIGGI